MPKAKEKEGAAMRNDVLIFPKTASLPLLWCSVLQRMLSVPRVSHGGRQLPSQGLHGGVWGMMELDKNQTLYRRSQLPPFRSESPHQQRSSYSPGSTRRRSSFFLSTNGNVLRTDPARRRRSSITTTHAEYIDSILKGDEGDEEDGNSPFRPGGKAETTPQLGKLRCAARRSSSEKGRRSSSSQQHHQISFHWHRKSHVKATRNSSSMSCDMGRCSYPFDTDREPSIINDTGMKESCFDEDVDDANPIHDGGGEEEDATTSNRSSHNHSHQIRPEAEAEQEEEEGEEEGDEEEEKSSNRKMVKIKGWRKEVSRNIRNDQGVHIAGEDATEPIQCEQTERTHEHNSTPPWIAHRSGRSHGRSASAKLFFYNNSPENSKPFRSPPARISYNQGTAQRWRVIGKGVPHSTTGGRSTKMKILEEERGEAGREHHEEEQQHPQLACQVTNNARENNDSRYKVAIVKKETEENPLNVIEI
eukprot:CAMPEP_0185280482 /NCGR_PEP_ID=MMETSP1359-20130426/66150_1 /TAXON_ID=552665 /ORGANISM="Bigelowiella longifila, Strain CCMP242" /LENGTH=473 /DNA_ID=CAMNT_0027875739 /DNA_START=244 /DNA_END=1666 /DNA_ORIENTATION=-